jgi:hypothetical protein
MVTKLKLLEALNEVLGDELKKAEAHIDQELTERWHGESVKIKCAQFSTYILDKVVDLYTPEWHVHFERSPKELTFS